MEKQSQAAPEQAIRVLIVDDHPVVREGLHAVLNQMPEFRVVGDALDGEEAIHLFQELRPDVTVMDLRLPKRSGLEACRAIRKLDPRAKILALTSSEEGLDVKAALAAGAAGFLFKGASGAEVAESIRRVHAGERPLSAEARLQLDRQPSTTGTTALTDRELEILGLVAQGLRNQMIADRLSLSLGTVKIHLNNLMSKLEVQDRTGAAMMALKKGLIRL